MRNEAAVQLPCIGEDSQPTEMADIIASMSFVPARKWHNLAEEVLDDADGYYQKVEKRAADRLTENAAKTQRFSWPWKKNDRRS
jgi:hypothetical protein